MGFKLLHLTDIKAHLQPDVWDPTWKPEHSDANA